MFSVLSLFTYAQTVSGMEDVFGFAAKENKPVLLVFSGSDWCQKCIRLDKTILSDSTFIQFSKTNFIIWKADFPQRKKLSAAEVKQNELLAEKYNPEGFFPQLLLIRPDKTVITTFTYNHQTCSEFISELNSYLSAQNMLHEYRKEIRLMGSAFELIGVDDLKSDIGWQRIEESISEIKRIENLLTEFSSDSQTALINRNAGIEPVQVDAEVFNIIERCKKISELTQGAFDITAGVLKKIYNFKGQDFNFPKSQQISETLCKVGFQNIQLLQENKVFLKKKGMQIGFGAIGKGYAADKVKAMMLSKKIENGVINASGDLTAWGKRADGSDWKVGIANPDKKNEILFWLPIKNSSIATSGDYEQFFIKDTVRYSHNINPKTGYPTTGIKSVSVVSPSAELSDALATAVLVMGKDSGLFLIEQLPDVHCIIIDEFNKVFHSSGLQFHNRA